MTINARLSGETIEQVYVTNMASYPSESDNESMLLDIEDMESSDCDSDLAPEFTNTRMGTFMVHSQSKVSSSMGKKQVMWTKSLQQNLVPMP